MDLDKFYVFSERAEPKLRTVACLNAPDGKAMEFLSNQLGAQVYSAGGLSAPFNPHDGLCIEPSGYPNAVNRRDVPTVLVEPKAQYRQRFAAVVVGF